MLRSDALNKPPPACFARRTNRRESLASAERNLHLLRLRWWATGPVQVAIKPPSPGLWACFASLSTGTNRCGSRHSEFSISTTTVSASRVLTAWNACAALPARSSAPVYRDRDNRGQVSTADARLRGPFWAPDGSFRHISSPFVITSLRWPMGDRPDGRLTASLPGHRPLPDVRNTL